MASAISDKPLSQRRQSNPGCLILFCALFALAGLAFFVYFVPYRLLRARAASSWSPVSCTIQSIGTKAHRGEDSTTYSINVNYSYVYNNRRYTGTHYDLFDATMSGAAANEIVRGLRPRTKTP